MRWNAGGCKHCQYLGDICPACQHDAETRADAAREPVTDARDTRAERRFEALVYGDIR